LGKVDTTSLNVQGGKEYHHQLGMEQFIISFFTNHHLGHQAFQLLKDGKREEALPLVQKLNPLETIGLYAETIAAYGATRGEEGILVSMNLRWLPDYIDLKQRAGLEPVRINFQPTSHDPLAQGAGHNTFFMDEEKNFWLGLGERELGVPAETNEKLPLEKVPDSWLNISEEKDISLKTMRSYNLPASEYEIQLVFGSGSAACKVQVVEGGKIVSSFELNGGQETAKGNFKAGGGEVSVKIVPQNGIVKFAGMAIRAN
jgi:hypothetical protein